MMGNRYTQDSHIQNFCSKIDFNLFLVITSPKDKKPLHL